MSGKTGRLHIHTVTLPSCSKCLVKRTSSSVAKKTGKNKGCFPASQQEFWLVTISTSLDHNISIHSSRVTAHAGKTSGKELRGTGTEENLTFFALPLTLVIWQPWRSWEFSYSHSGCNVYGCVLFVCLMGVFTMGKGPEWLSSATVSPIPIIHTQCFCINFVSFLDTGFTSLCTRFWPSGHVARVWSWGTASPQQCWGTWDTCWKQDTNIVPKHNVDCYNSPLKVTSGPSTEIQTKSVLQGPEFSLKQLLSAMGINAKAGLRIVLLLTCCSFHLRHTNLEAPAPPPRQFTSSVWQSLTVFKPLQTVNRTKGPPWLKVA